MSNYTMIIIFEQPRVSSQLESEPVYWFSLEKSILFTLVWFSILFETFHASLIPTD